jgi:hypothetical protein
LADLLAALGVVALIDAYRVYPEYWWCCRREFFECREEVIADWKAAVIQKDVVPWVVRAASCIRKRVEFWALG